MLRKLVNLAAYYAQYRDYSYFKAGPPLAGSAGKLPLVISVDVEASPRYLSEDHAGELIWGRFGDETAGITRMMDVAEACGHRLTFFLDYCERFLYPDHFEKITRSIQSRGHDLQLHAHIELLPATFWNERGISGGHASLTTMSYPAARALLEFLIDSAVTLGDGTRPVAFRGGNFRFSKGILDAMRDVGLTLSFNYNVESCHQSNNGEVLPLFQWSNGVYEVPLSVLKIEGRTYPFDFNEFNSFSTPRSAYHFLAVHRQAAGEEAVAVLLMHSWSFCNDNLKRTRKYYRNGKKISNFESFLLNLPDGVETITASQLHQRLLQGKQKAKLIRETGLVEA